MKALVIDDDEVARELLCGELRKAGFEVMALPSPIGATRVILEQSLDAVVIDVVMPALRGDRLAKLLRGNPRLDKLAVILVSGDTSVELRELAASVGADAVVDKAGARKSLASVVSAAARARNV